LPGLRLRVARVQRGIAAAKAAELRPRLDPPAVTERPIAPATDPAYATLHARTVPSHGGLSCGSGHIVSTR